MLTIQKGSQKDFTIPKKGHQFTRRTCQVLNLSFSRVKFEVQMEEMVIFCLEGVIFAIIIGEDHKPNFVEVLKYTPPKTNMEPQNDGFSKESPLLGVHFQVPC